MKEQKHRSSFRGRNLIDSVSRALSPSRSRIKSSSPDKNAKVNQSKELLKKSTTEIKLKDKAAIKSVPCVQNTDKSSYFTQGIEISTNISDSVNKQKKSVKSISSSSTSGDDNSAVTLYNKETVKPDQDPCSSSGASSQNSGDSTPTKASMLIEYIQQSDLNKVKSYKDNDSESIYESRKLLFRKMIELEVKELGKIDADDSASVADSWDDLEENFAKIYEPIPLKDTFDRNTKEQLLKKISNPLLRREISKMSRDEIVYNLNYLNEEVGLQKNADDVKHQIYNEMTDSGFSPSTEREILADVHRSQSDSSESELTLKDSDGSPFGETDYETRTELYRNIRNLRNSLARRRQQQQGKERDDDVDSWKSMATDDEPVYVSRSEILSRHDLKTPQSEITMRAPSRGSLNTRKVKNFISRSEILSRLDRLQEREEMRAHSPGDISCSSQDSWSIKDHELIYERKLVPAPQTNSQEHPNEENNIMGEDEVFNATDDFDILDDGHKRRELLLAGAAELQRRVMAILATQQHIAPSTKSKVMDIINQHIQDNSNSQDYAQFEQRNEEIRNKLKEALAHDWETLSNINLGLIYVPMEENMSIHSKKSGTSRDLSDYDTFGSLDSLIFEPKVPSDPPISEEFEEQSSISNFSQLSVSLNVLPDCMQKVEDEFKGMSKVKNLVTSFDDIYSGKCISYDPKNNETSITSFKVGDIVKKMQSNFHAKKCIDSSLLHCNNNSDNVNQIVEVNNTRSNVNVKSGNKFKNKFCGAGNDRVEINLRASNGSISSRLSSVAGVASRGSSNNKAQQPRGDPHQESPADAVAPSAAAVHLPAVPVVSADEPSKSATHSPLGAQPVSNQPPPLPRKPSRLRNSKSYDSASNNSAASSNSGTSSSNSDSIEAHNSEALPTPAPQIASGPPKVPFKKKIISSLVGLGFRRFSSKESIKINNHSPSSASIKSNNSLENIDNKDHPDIMIDDKNECSSTIYMDINQAAEESADVTDKKLMCGDHSTDELENHYEAAPNSCTITSVDSESESITSIESVIFRGDVNTIINSNIAGGKKSVVRRDKYVVNRDHESDTSEFDKSASVSTALNIDSDTSWDYVHASNGGNPNDNNRVSDYNYGSTTSLEGTSEMYGPRVIGNLRRKKSNQLTEKRIPTPIESFFNELRCQANMVGNVNFEESEESQDSSDTHKFHEERHDLSCTSSSSSAPPVLLLNHHVYQSIESLVLQAKGHSHKNIVVENPISAELQVYRSKNGEPIYGARNSLVYQTMNGAYVTREPPSNPKEPPVIIRHGKVVELTEEMFSASLNDKEENENKISATSSCIVAESLEKVDEISTAEIAQSDVKNLENQEDLSLTSEKCDNTLSCVDDFLCDVNDEEDNSKIRRVQKVGVSILGNKNNDLMIRELKLRLRTKFNACDSEEDCLETPQDLSLVSDNISLEGSSALAGDGRNSIASTREKLAPQMNKIFGSLLAKRRQIMRHAVDPDTNNSCSDSIAEMIVEESPTETSVKATTESSRKQSPIAPPRRKRESIEICTGGGSIKQMWLPTPDYTPLSTLPRDDDTKENSQVSEFSLDLNYFVKLIHDPANRSCVPTPDYDLTPTPCPECDCQSYASEVHPNAFKSSDNPSSPKRSVRFDMSKHFDNISATWSDIESVIFTEDRSFGSILIEGLNRPPRTSDETQVGSNRMDSYQDGLLWDQLALMRKSKVPEDRERWEMEKTKRMLLWIHLSTNNDKAQWCYRSHWWKVRIFFNKTIYVLLCYFIF